VYIRGSTIPGATVRLSVLNLQAIGPSAGCAVAQFGLTKRGPQLLDILKGMKTICRQARRQAGEQAGKQASRQASRH
jgi:hypothetical protein